jgi:ABC-type antimicrobial peptide transport system permease subunit
MQRALASVDPNLPFSGFYRMQDVLAKTLAMQRVQVALLSTMAILALLMSAVGIFALVANMVTQRTHEIGIRMALGSTIGEAMVQVGRSGAGAAILGLFLDLVACTGALRVMHSVLFGVGVYDTPTIVAVVVAPGSSNAHRDHCADSANCAHRSSADVARGMSIAVPLCMNHTVIAEVCVSAVLRCSFS